MSTCNSGGTAEARAEFIEAKSFVPDVDEGFFYFMESVSLLTAWSELHDSKV
jgi:hypothetical protein